MQPGVSDNTALHRFDLLADGATAFLVYERSGDLLRLIHTEVPDALQGKGVGSRLVSAALAFAHENQLRVVPLCSFVTEYLKRHPEQASIVDSQHRWRIQSGA